MKPVGDALRAAVGDAPGRRARRGLDVLAGHIVLRSSSDSSRSMSRCARRSTSSGIRPSSRATRKTSRSASSISRRSRPYACDGVSRSRPPSRSQAVLERLLGRPPQPLHHRRRARRRRARSSRSGPARLAVVLHARPRRARPRLRVVGRQPQPAGHRRQGRALQQQRRARSPRRPARRTARADSRLRRRPACVGSASAAARVTTPAHAGPGDHRRHGQRRAPGRAGGPAGSSRAR